MNLRLPKSALALFLATAAGVAAAVVTIPDSANISGDVDAVSRSPAEITNVSTVAPASNQASKLLSIDQFMTIPADRRPVEIDLRVLDKNWDIAYVPILLESARFMPPYAQNELVALLQRKTTQQYGTDYDQWRNWLWKQKFKPHPDLAKVKSKLYSKIDPRFAEYFSDADGATIRLDEIRWGGVRRDGIPPLNKPQMISAAQATYLADSDVVFGVDINGDARCYPKRILAWHEMFKDTIGGESVCGVY